MNKQDTQLILEFIGYVKTAEDRDFCFYENNTENCIKIPMKNDPNLHTRVTLVEANAGTLFHISWDWLMHVVDYIEGKNLGNLVIPEFGEDSEYLDCSVLFKVQGSTCYVNLYGDMKLSEDIVRESGDTKKAAIYNAVVSTIKYLKSVGWEQ